MLTFLIAIVLLVWTIQLRFILRSQNQSNLTVKPNQGAAFSNQNHDLEAFFTSSTNSSRMNPSQIVDQDLGLSTTNRVLPMQDDLSSIRDQQGLLDLSINAERGRMNNTNCISSGSSETNILDKVECSEESDGLLLGTIPSTSTSGHLISGTIFF